jgi:hypothetical protein
LNENCKRYKRKDKSEKEKEKKQKKIKEAVGGTEPAQPTAR